MKKKNVNKIIIWLFLWSAISGISFFIKSKKWRKKFNNLKKDFKSGIQNMKNTFRLSFHK